MKKILSAIILCVIFTSCNNTVEKRDSFVINGTAKGIYNGIRVYLKVIDEKGRQINKDTAIVFNEAFTFEGKVESPQLWFAFVDNLNGNMPIVMENDVINLEINKDDIKASKVTGTKGNEKFLLYSEKMKNLTSSRMTLGMEFRQATQTNDSIKVKQLTSELDNLTKEMNDYPFEFIKEHNNNAFSLTLVESLIEGKDIDLNNLIDAFNALDNDLKKSDFGQVIYEKILVKKKINDGLANLNIGKVAPKFSAPSTDGKLIALDDIRGKVTIIDFWASWCGPCRRENPNVVRTYEKYHDKGLEIISVSLDKPGQKDRWLKAIEDDKLNWHHVSNLNYFNDPVARQYNIQSIPATYILDADGKIVAKNLRGSALEEKIAELLN